MRVAIVILFCACSEPAPVVQREPQPIAQPQPEPPPEPEVAPEPPPAPPDPSGGPACSTDWDCVLVTGGCDGPAAAHRSVAAEIDAQNELRMSAVRCRGGDPPPPVRPFCGGRPGSPPRCVTLAVDHPEWRTCRRDADCTFEVQGCHHWEAVSTDSADEAQAAWMPEGPCPGIIPQMPRARCFSGYCAGPWGGR